MTPTPAVIHRPTQIPASPDRPEDSVPAIQPAHTYVDLSWLIFAIPSFSLDAHPFLDIRNKAGEADIGLSSLAHRQIQELARHPASKDIPCKLSTLTKGATWFDALMLLLFSGQPVEDCSNKELGINKPGSLDQNMVYRAVISKIRALHGAREPAAFQELLSWLIQTNFIKEFPCPDILRNVPNWFKAMRAELIGYVDLKKIPRRYPFDGQQMNCPGSYNIHQHEARHIRLKAHILSSLLERADKALSRETIDNWLHKPEHAGIRSILFAQDAHPLNTTFNHYVLWSPLLHALAPQLPEAPDSSLKNAFATATSHIVSSENIEGACHYIATDCFGRTLVLQPYENENRFLKIQSSEESDEEFLRTTERVSMLSHYQRQGRIPLESEMVCVKRVIRIDDIQTFLPICDGPETVLNLTGEGSRLAVEFTTSSAHSYQTYIYDLLREEQLPALLTYLHDYGLLWSMGICGPANINAFHATEAAGGRQHLTFPDLEFPTRNIEGSLQRWNGLASDYPNVGAVGMRDVWDAHLPQEKKYQSATYYGDTDSKSVSSKKHRILELAHAAQGAVLIYARCNNRDFDVADPAKVDRVANDLSNLMVTLFTQAFPITKTECQALMEEHDLLNQCAREINYWMAHHESQGFYYVEDLRNSEINRNAYPLLPEAMHGCVLRENQREFLKDCGFHYSERDRPGECQLGSYSGRTPLLALNAMLTKLISSGILHSLKEQDQKSSHETKELTLQSESKKCIIV